MTTATAEHPSEKLAYVDPMRFKDMCWPHVKFYKQQWEVIYSVVNNKETYVPAGNKLGKDFVAGFIILYFYLTRHPCRIVTTSAKDDHLRVLWGEIKNFIATSAIPLSTDQGGPLVVNHREIKKLVNGEECPKSYIKGLVASADSMATMQGHHIAETGDGIPRTLVVGDEASGLDNDYKPMFDSWANRQLYIGNTWPCANFWRFAIKGKPGSDDVGGDIPRPVRLDGKPPGYHRKIIKVRAQDSPNVILGLAEIKAGKQPTGRFVVPGVKGIEEYLENRELWDPIQQAVSLDAEFYEGAEVMMFPAEWLGLALHQAELLGDRRTNGGGHTANTLRALGIDTGEGVADTSWTVIDERGVIDQVSKKTPDTNVIPAETIAIGSRYNVPASYWGFDLGGGGKQHMDRLRAMGYPCRGVAFGETLTMEPKRGLVQIEEKKEHREERYVYVNRRAEMYGNLRLAIDPGNPLGLANGVFALPARFAELHRQLALIPLLYDREGRIRMLPKNKQNADSDEETLTERLGCSPDEADSLVIALWMLLNKPKKNFAGAMR